MKQLIKSFICFFVGHQWEQTKVGFKCKRCGKEMDFGEAESLIESLALL